MAIVGASALVAGSTVYSANKQSSAASSASRKQAEGVEAARADTLAATDRARAQMMGGYQQQGPSSFDPQAAQVQGVDPRNEYLTGVNTATGFLDQGYNQGSQYLSPLAKIANQYLGEQGNLLGMNGDASYQDALSRVSDPLVAEQERAILRNNAALGGVGGGTLAELAEQTRRRTEANIGNRLSQLGNASAPGLTALQQLAQMSISRGQNMSDIFNRAGGDLSAMETNRRQALANLELGQGSELAQLSQNLGTARAGGDAFRAQQVNPWVQGIQSGLGAYMGMGGTFGGGSMPPPQNTMPSWVNMGNQAGQVNLPRY